MDDLTPGVGRKLIGLVDVDPLANRVARRFLAAEMDERLKALLLKLRKGADSSVSMKQMVGVLNYLGGWKVEPFNGLTQMHGHTDPDAPNVEADENPATVQAAWEQIKKDEVHSLPTNPVPGKRYTMNVTEPSSHDWRAGLTGFKYKEWKGAHGLRFTAPNGKVFEQVPGKYDRYADPMKAPLYDIRPWLHKETPFLEQVSNALGMETHEAEKANKKQPTRENTGTCPCCFRNIKLKARSDQHPAIVLHGYLRPGWGSIHGQCYGVNYPPFELSDEGTKHLVHQILHPRVKGEENFLHRLQSGQVTELHEQRGNKLITMTPETEGPATWARHIEYKIKSVEREISALKHDIELLTGLIASWKLEPLPQPGQRIKAPPSLLR
jgi:hypothetical protein